MTWGWHGGCVQHVDPCDVCRDRFGRQDLPRGVSGPPVPLCSFPNVSNFSLSILCDAAQSHPIIALTI